MRVGAGFGPRQTAGFALVVERGVEQTLARRTFDVIDIVEILIHWYAGRSQHGL